MNVVTFWKDRCTRHSTMFNATKLFNGSEARSQRSWQVGRYWSEYHGVSGGGLKQDYSTLQPRDTCSHALRVHTQLVGGMCNVDQQ